MTDVVLALVGLVLVVGVAFDFAATTLSVSLVRGSIARAVTRLSRGSLRHAPRRLRVAAGPLTVAAVIVAWLGVAGAGWAMATAWMHQGGPVDHLVTAFSTLAGGPDPTVVAVAGRPGRVLLAAQHLYGLALLSLALAWVLPVVSSVAARRGLAARVNLLLDGGLEWVEGGAHLQLLAIAQELVEIAERHRAYPVLHVFRTSEPKTSLPVALARLDRLVEELEDTAFDPATLRLLDRGLRHFLDVHAEAFALHDTDDAPRRHLVDHLREDAGWGGDEPVTTQVPLG